MDRQISLTLCGFMGCGKSTVGRALAQRLSYDFLDTDQLLGEQTGLTIPEMFARGGETYFRDCEHEAVKTAAARQRAVIATGGGVMIFARNAELLAEKTKVIHLRRAFDDCYLAVSAQPDRPIVKTHTREELRAMYERRDTCYARYAALTVDNDGTVEEAVARILKQLMR